MDELLKEALELGFHTAASGNGIRIESADLKVIDKAEALAKKLADGAEGLAVVAKREQSFYNNRIVQPSVWVGKAAAQTVDDLASALG